MPLLIPLAAFFSGSNSGLAFVLVMSVVFGGVPYLLTSIVLWFLLGKCRSWRSFIRTIISAPLLFFPLQVLTSIFGWNFLESATSNYLNDIESLLTVAAFSLTLGYLYVLLVLAALTLAVYFNLVTAPK